MDELVKRVLEYEAATRISPKHTSMTYRARKESEEQLKGYQAIALYLDRGIRLLETIAEEDIVLSGLSPAQAQFFTNLNTMRMTNPMGARMADNYLATYIKVITKKQDI